MTVKLVSFVIKLSAVNVAACRVTAPRLLPEVSSAAPWSKDTNVLARETCRFPRVLRDASEPSETEMVWTLGARLDAELSLPKRILETEPLLAFCRMTPVKLRASLTGSLKVKRINMGGIPFSITTATELKVGLVASPMNRAME